MTDGLALFEVAPLFVPTSNVTDRLRGAFVDAVRAEDSHPL